MIKAFNLTILDVVTYIPFVISIQLIMIENIYLVQSFPYIHNNIKSNNGYDNFRKKQDIINLYVMNNNDESSNNNNNDTVSSSFPSLKKISETEDGIIIDNNIHDDGSNNTNNEGRRINEHKKDYFMREAKYTDLPAVARIVVDAFYDSKSLFKQYNILAELNRLQSNFPYDNELHQMYVACSNNNSNDDNSSIIGFADIDCRQSKIKNAPPRPYLSDLVVHKKYRRKGIASTLIKSCEDMVINKLILNREIKNCLYLRVERDNQPALRMYSQLGYEPQISDIFGVIDTTILLKRTFILPPTNDLIKNTI